MKIFVLFSFIFLGGFFHNGQKVQKYGVSYYSTFGYGNVICFK